MSELLSLSRLDTFLNSLEKLATARNLSRAFIRLFKMCILAAAIYGGVKGIEESISLIRRRQPIRLSNKTLEPIVNILAQIGIITVRPILTALQTAIVVATAPISVPYIILLCKEEDADKERRQRDDADNMRTLR